MNSNVCLPLLSIVIPTLNRPLLLRETLLRIASHYPVTDSRLEFIVVDNASDCQLNTIISSMSDTFFGRLKLIHFQERLEITESFSRSVSCSTGKYIQIFGDDDLPIGRLGYYLLDILESNQNPIIYINRLIGNSSLSHVAEVAHPADAAYVLMELSLSDFICKYTHWPGFITSLVFARSAWDSGKQINKNNYPGYTFLDYIYRSSKSQSVLVVGEPLVIQRRGVQDWKKYWPLYWYQGMARLLSDLDRDGISSGALTYWLDHELQITNHIIDLLIAKSLPKIYKSLYWLELVTLFRGRGLFEFFVWLIRFIPTPVARLILLLSPNRDKYGKLF